MTKMWKTVRRHPDTGRLLDTFSGRLDYSVGTVVTDDADHGLSVHTTAARALSHPVPAGSIGRGWPAVLLRVEVAESDILGRGRGEEKTLVRRLRVLAIDRDNIHQDIAQQGLTPYRLSDGLGWLDRGWGGFREVASITRGAKLPAEIAEDQRSRYGIECRPASSGRYGKSVAYRAVPR